jgi:hypothetical protein
VVPINQLQVLRTVTIITLRIVIQVGMYCKHGIHFLTIQYRNMEDMEASPFRPSGTMKL